LNRRVILAKKKKSKMGRSILIVGIIGVIIFFLLNGNFSFDLLGGDTEMDDNEVTQVENDSSEETSEIVIEVIDNRILVNEKEVILEELILEIGENQQVILRAKDAKQIKYDEVKSLLQSNDIIIIEE